MAIILARIDGRNPATGEVVTLRAASVDDDRVCHLNDQIWWPALTALPALKYDLFDGSFGAAITTPQSSIGLAIEAFGSGAGPKLPALMLADSRVQLWAGDLGAPWSAYQPLFDGRVMAQPGISGGVATFSIAVDDRWLDAPLLDTYAGTTGIEGDAALKGQPKPLALGAPRFVSGTLIDTTNTVVQLSAYGPIEDVEVALDRLARFGASAGDYASYAALIAATIPAGRWATCKAQGLVRHGAPPEGRLSYLVRGDKGGAGGWVRKPGALIKRIALMRGAIGQIDTASLDALDAARPWNVSIQVSDQTTARQLIQQLAASVNAVAGVTWLGKLFVTPVAFGTPAITLDASGAALPAVASVEQLDIAAPFWKLAIEAERTWSVHALSEVAFTATLVERGLYVPAESYREGHIVALADGSRWLYVATTASSGNAPTNGSSFWSLLSGPVSVAWSDITDPSGTKPADNADVTGDNIAGGIIGQGPGATADNLAQFDPAAASALQTVQQAITNIADDNLISTAEKWPLMEVHRQYSALHSSARATSITLQSTYGDDPASAQRAAADTAMNSLNAYLAGLTPSWADPAVATPVDGGTLRSHFQAVATTIAALIGANTDIGSQRALVDGRIYDAATGNFLTRSGLITTLGISSGFNGQGTLATQNAVNLASQVTGLLGLTNADAALRNTSISIGPNGALSGAGGGAVTFGGLGGGAVGQLTEIFFGNSLLRETSGGTPATLAAFKTASGTAAAIAGQGAGATANSLSQLNPTEGTKLTGIAAGATNDKIVDGGGSNELPSWYRANYPMRAITEVKFSLNIGMNLAGGYGYGALTTTVDFVNFTGGRIKQRFVSSAGLIAIRFGNADDTGWDAWAADYNEFRKPYFGSDLLEASGGAIATLPNFKTASGTAAAIAGQGTLATQSSVNLGSQVSGTLGIGNAAAGLQNANITIASNGALSGAGGGAVTIGGLGYSGALNATYGARAGTNVYRTDGATVMTQAELRTAEGVAASISGQGLLATQNSLTLGGGFLNGFGTFAALSQINAGNITNFIANQAIGAAVIANASIGTAHIDQIAVSKIVASSLSALSANIGLLRTATTGARMEIESNQLRSYHPNNQIAVRLGVWS